MENILNMNTIEIKKKKLFKNIAIIIFFTTSILVHRIFVKWDVENPYLETTLFCLRTFNFLLALLASASCLISYERIKDNSVFIISLVYAGLSTDILFSQVDYVTSNVSFRRVVMLPAILRVVLLIISIYPKSKISNLIISKRIKSTVFVILFTIVVGHIEKNIGLGYSAIFLDMYKTIATILYMIVAIILFFRGIKDNEYSFIILSLSIFIFQLRYSLTFYLENIDVFYSKLILVCITYASSLIVIAGSFVELYIYIKKSRMLTKNLNVFYSMVDNDKNSFMIICNEKGDTIYVNKKVKEHYANLGCKGIDNLNSTFHNVFDGLDINEEIFTSLNKSGVWRGIIKNSFDEMMLDCSMQLIDGFNNKEIAISYKDISDEVKKELEIEKLKIYSNERTQFISNISHELRTPVNIFYSTIQLLDRVSLKDDEEFKLIYEKYKKTLYINCKRMLRLINNVIDVSKIETGALVGRFDNYNVISVVEDVALSVVNYARLKNIKIQFDTNIEENIIKCDPHLLERVILNLLSNAIKFSSQESIIYVSMLVSEDFTEIKIKDEGIGIDKEYKKIIFERFVQADKSLTRENEGSGIGLSIVKSILDLHEGSISLESEVGKGSTFIVKLPNRSISDEVCKIYDINNENVELELSDIYEVLGMK